LYTKYYVHSKDTEGVTKSKSRSRDQYCAPLGAIYHKLAITCGTTLYHMLCIGLYPFLKYRRDTKFRNGSRDQSNAPFI